MRKRSLLLIAGACLATITLTVGSAIADPNGSPTFRQLAGVGAETTQGVMNALSDIIKDSNGTKIIASYDNAPQPSNITTKDPNVTPGCTIARPAQGGAGTDALTASLRANDHCVDFARVVTNDSATRQGPGLTYIPFAVDALTYAIRDDSPIGRDLSIADLTSIYNCQVPSIHPLLGGFGAGNRTFFLKKLNITDAANLVTQPGHTCIKDTDANNQPLLANDGRVLTDPSQIITYSSAPYLAQINNVVPDKHGTAVLGSINAISPAILNNSSVMSRDVYNVVPTTQLGIAPTSTVFVGSGPGSVCSNSATIVRNGFNLNPACGTTNIQSTPSP